MSETAYHDDCYLTKLETEIVAIGEENGTPFAVLGDTLFYPEGGGQPASCRILWPKGRFGWSSTGRGAGTTCNNTPASTC